MLVININYEKIITIAKRFMSFVGLMLIMSIPAWLFVGLNYDAVDAAKTIGVKAGLMYLIAIICMIIGSVITTMFLAAYGFREEEES